VVQTTKQGESTPAPVDGLPAVRDPEVDAVMAFLDDAVSALEKADAAAAKAARNSASAALIVARHKRSGEVHRKAIEVKLKAEARLGHLAGPPLDEKARTAKATAARMNESPAATRDDLADLDKHDLARCRKVAAVAGYLPIYLNHVAAAGEEPTRAGLLSFAAAQEKARADGRAAAEGRRAPAAQVRQTQAPNGKPAIDVGAVVKQGAMDEAGSKAPAQAALVIPPPKGAPPVSSSPLPTRPVGAVGSRWLASVRRCIGEVEQAQPSGGWFVTAHKSLLASLRDAEANCVAFVGEEEETLRGKAS
jgi:hypothetical protein